MRRAGLEPLVPYPGSKVPWPAIHTTCGSEVTPIYNSVQQGGRGCQVCSKRGFDYVAGGQVYLVAHRDLEAVKIGITGADVDGRVTDHERHGWHLVAWVPDKSGQEAYDLEQMILKWWRNDLQVPAVVSASDMPQGGHTETAPWEVLSKTLDVLRVFGVEII